MLLGFKDQFAPYVCDGSKTHTIRALRKVRPRVGETCHCYSRVRQKNMTLLGRFPCVKVDDIEITGGLGGIAEIRINGEALSTDEMRALAERDGFRDGADPLTEMSRFWETTHLVGPTHVWRGQIIHWRFA